MSGYKREKNSRQLKKIVMMMRLVYFTQTAVIIAVALVSGISYYVQGDLPSPSMVVLLLSAMALMVLFNGYFIFRDTNIFKSLNNQIEIKDEAYKNIEALNLELRAQRHDFLNHIQILYSLMELGEHEETTNYLNRLYGDVGKLSANIKTSSVAVNALLQAKANEAENRKLRYETVINTRLEEMNIPDWELCRVLGNLIDNGFEAAEQMSSDGCVCIYFLENIKDYIIEIHNSSPLLTDGMIEKLFDAGFTTKKDGINHGMGLFISNEIMKKYNNDIWVAYVDGQVVVRMTIHKMVSEVVLTDS